MNISIIFISCRKDAKLDWFCDSLFRQLTPDLNIQLIYIDYWHGQRDIVVPNKPIHNFEFLHIPPLPSPCQGKHKLTSSDWFSATIMRNTGLVFALHPYCVFCDDLSILQPEWITAIKEAAQGRYVIQGAYRKDKSMIVENGVIVSSESDGVDSRMRFSRGIKTKGHADWCYGNIGLPLDMALEVNGWDELCSIISYEDVQLGIRLNKLKANFVYDTRMLSVESSELHFVEGNYFQRIDPEISQTDYINVLKNFGCAYERPHNGRHDASHAMLTITKQKTYKANWNPYDLRELRRKRESGQKITVEDMKFRTLFWFTGQPLNEM